MSAAIRQRRYRQRQATGLAVIEIEIDEAATTAVLEKAELLPQMTDHTRDDIAHAVERLLTLLDRDG